MNSERNEVRVVSECDVFQVLRKVESCYASVGEKFSVHVHDADLIEADFGQNKSKQFNVCASLKKSANKAGNYIAET